MPTIDLRPAVKKLSDLIEGVHVNTLSGATPCSKYSTADLLDHIAGITVAFGGAAVKARGGSADMGPQGDASHLDPDWRTSLPQRLDTLARAWLDPDAWTGMTSVGGQDLPGEVVGIILFGELTVHGWDLAQAIDAAFEPDPSGLDPLFEVVRQTFGPGHDEARGTAFGPAVPVSSDAPIFDQTLGLLGRDPNWSPFGNS